MLIATYNIQWGMGQDGIVDLARIARTVGSADIICLQEVERDWRKMPEADQVRARALELRLTGDDPSESDAVEQLRLGWPSYFADPEHAPPMPPMRIGLPAQALFGEIAASLPALEASLPRVAR